MRVFLAVFLTIWAGAALAETDPSQLFAQSCGRCHRDAVRMVAKVDWAADIQTPEARRDWFDGFMVRHHSPDADSRAAIAEWLAGIAS